jgi:DNA (cytosine-5)-methyltransferase 1
MLTTYLEFFCGGGLARIGLGPSRLCLFANDTSSAKGRAYVANFGRDHLMICDIATVPISAFPPGRVDYAWMSPPCVGHSEAGNRQGFDEEESRAFWPAWAHIETLDALGRAPLTAVFENVDGIKPKNLRAVQEAFTRAHYRHATGIIDARHFVPQSRKRYFVVGAHRDLGVDPEPLMEAAMRALPERTIGLADVIDFDATGCKWEYPPAEVQRYLAMLSPLQDARLRTLLATGRSYALPFSKRMRGPKSGERVQRVEFRQGIASALRVPSSQVNGKKKGGGSSKQYLILVTPDGKIRMRAIQPREAARLMGLPRDPIEALSLLGDGVVVPVVRASWPSTSSSRCSRARL